MLSKKKKQTLKRTFNMIDIGVDPYPVTVRQIETVPPAFQKKIDKSNEILSKMIFLKRP